MKNLELRTVTTEVLTKAELGDKVFEVGGYTDDGTIMSITSAQDIQKEYEGFEFHTFDDDDNEVAVELNDVALKLDVNDGGGGWTEFYDFFGRQVYEN